METTIRQNRCDFDLRSEPESCLVGERLAEELGVERGMQIRVGSATSVHQSGLYTVAGIGGNAGTVEMSKSGLERLQVKNNAVGFARAGAPHPEYETRAAASRDDEYAEIVVDDGAHAGLVACAPHGGWIEYGTDEQARRVADRLGATEWSCVGYNSGGGAYDRWHVTSTDIDRRSFPRLDAIADRGFAYAVSFHGFSDDGIAVGGGASRALKAAVRDEIDAATGGRYDVSVAADGVYDGDSPENFVNWLAEDGDGVQIEQCWTARAEDRDAIADAVARVYADRL